MNKRPILASAIALFLSGLLFASSVAAQGGVKGKIRNNKGAGIAGATVTARRGGVDIKSTRSDSKGSFTLLGLSSGTYNIVFDADGYATGVKFGVQITDGNTRDLGDRLILSVDQGTQLIIKGSVFDKNGISILGAKVEIERINEDGSTKSLGTTYTSSGGEFTYRPPLSTSRVRVTAKFKGVSGSKEISEIGGAGIYRTAITLDVSQGDN